MNTERAQLGWGFWLWWVLASTVGMAVGIAVLEAAVFRVLGAVGGAVDGVVAGAVVGTSVGIAQWLVLRRQVSRAGWWVLASIVGFAVGFGVGVGWVMASAVAETVTVGLYAGWAVGGASVGIAQWLVLRRQVSRAGWGYWPASWALT